tara:strand:+ start:1100 stop:2008 length:909 start_codon:yes stop_codon:yes gene_type:complete
MAKFLNKAVRGAKIRATIQYNRLINLVNIFKLNLIKKNSFEWLDELKQLQENGFAKIPMTANLEKIDNFISNNYLNSNYIKLQSKMPEINQFGVSSIEVDINSEIFTKHIFSKNLKKLISEYYKKKFWLRNAPVFRIDVEKKRTDDSNRFQQRLFHLDYAERQLSLVVFLNDLHDNSTHTEYVPKTNKKSWFLQNDERTNLKFQKKVNKLIRANGTKKIIGKKGEMYLFDAGNGLHRGFPGDDRYMIHMNFAQMRRYAYYEKNYELNQQTKKNNYFRIYPNKATCDKLLKNNWKKENLKYLT